MQNPVVQQNHTAMKIVGANIQEHQAVLYRQQIEQALGQQLPHVGQVPPEIVDQIAGMAAQATQQVTGQAQAMAQAQAYADKRHKCKCSNNN